MPGAMNVQHILGPVDPKEATPIPPLPLALAPNNNDMPPPPNSQPQQPQQEEHEQATSGTPDEPNSPDEAVYTSTTTSTRRNASGSVSSVYSGNKIRHLKKEDGIPLWRKDIQYEFLKLVLYDQTKCFTKQSDGTTGYTFADVYVDAMAKSSKCSKILKEKLLMDTEGAIHNVEL
jgi:Ino eighty subunit 1